MDPRQYHNHNRFGKALILFIVSLFGLSDVSSSFLIQPELLSSSSLLSTRSQRPFIPTKTGTTNINTNFYTKSNSNTKRYFAKYGGDDQATEAIKSFVEYHEGRWKGTARSFTVVPDTAAGIVQRKVSPEYEVSVRLGLKNNFKQQQLIQLQQQQQLQFQETFSWDDNDKNHHISSRLLSINDCNMDVDSVDASYSLDTTLPDFPIAISGTNKKCQFLIEHCIATSEDRRMRCFVMYGGGDGNDGVDQSLQRVIVCDETKIITNDDNQGAKTTSTTTDSNNNGVFTAADLLEMQSDVDRLVDKLTGGSSSSSSSSKIVDPNFPITRPEDKMMGINSGNGNGNGNAGGDEQQNVVNKTKPSDEGARKLSLHDITLLELSSGVWLGDAIIRDHPTVATSPLELGRGFGPKKTTTSSSSSSSIPTSEFGDWSVGVQKVAWRWMWNFGEELRQIIDVGKAMGAQLAECMSSQSISGSVCVNESLSRRIAKADRMVYLDLNNDLVGFLVGPVSIQVPRYLNFYNNNNGGEVSMSSTRTVVKKPFYSEFCVYQSADPNIATNDNNNNDNNNEKASNDKLPELCCSKISRVYNFEGKLKQGCTSFYTFKRFGIDGEIED